MLYEVRCLKLNEDFIRHFSGSWDNCLNCPASARIISSFDFKHRTSYNISFNNNSVWKSPLPAAPRAELRRAQLNSIGRMRMKVAYWMTAVKWSCAIPEHSTQVRCFWLGVDSGQGGKPEYPEKPLKSGWDQLKLRPRTIAEVGGANEEYNANMTSKTFQSIRWVIS